MSALDRILLRSGLGLVPPLTSTARELVSHNPRTLGVRAHAVADAHGRTLEVIEKRVENRPAWTGTSTEVAFYEQVLPRWPFMASHACRFYGARRGLTATTIFIEAARAPGPEDRDPINAAFALLPEMHRTGAELLASGALGTRLTRRLDFWNPAMKRGLHAARLEKAALNPRCAGLVAPRKDALLATLDRLALASRAAPRAICHLDLLRTNICVGPAGPVLIDWGEVAIAPAGYDYGSLLASVVRSHKPRPARLKLSRMWGAMQAGAERSPDGETTLAAAYYYFLFGLVRYLAGLKRNPPTEERVALIAEIFDDACGSPQAPG